LKLPVLYAEKNGGYKPRLNGRTHWYPSRRASPVSKRFRSRWDGDEGMARLLDLYSGAGGAAVVLTGGAPGGILHICLYTKLCQTNSSLTLMLEKPMTVGYGSVLAVSMAMGKCPVLGGC